MSFPSIESMPPKTLIPEEIGTIMHKVDSYSQTTHSSFPSLDYMSGVVFRVKNFFKAMVGQSDWQQARKELRDKFLEVYNVQKPASKAPFWKYDNDAARYSIERDDWDLVAECLLESYQTKMKDNNFWRDRKVTVETGGQSEFIAWCREVFAPDSLNELKAKAVWENLVD